ncbi:Occlusion-derived virus envelope protein-18 [Trabala vishnou gigantina nucleopolyhedrovirus]|uniref:Occlusion-derived virus envelope protein-18 n=1 Tax=Trabala vishnou gigantina nucleopolyhedrovirus TaxID=2863583 RepID=UPI002481D45D|nr:Occlusion-derived virus envelope protein-18 [Trabala vishnou gigantina nucleopolyhedrovirus]QYC92782.1 Occlusion-derived virus envelope protein-18 [Trabala vishnou gigantina nucleopolyhedrovirus]
MEDINPAQRFMNSNPTLFNTSTLMSILIGLVIIILLVMLFQSSSNGNGSMNSSGNPAEPNRLAYTNPLNATMRNNPFVNTAQRTML